MPDALPTCWRCPDCGRTEWPGLLPDKWVGSTIHLRVRGTSASGNCEGMPVRGTFVPDGTPSEQILNGGHR